MSQTLILEAPRPAKSQWRTALEIGQSEKADLFKVNLIVDTIQALVEDKRVKAFFELDFNQAVEETLIGTLIDIQKIRESQTELDLVIAKFNEQKAYLKTRELEIIAKRAEAGVIEEDCFKIVPVIKKTNREPDITRIKEDYPDEWDTVVGLKVKQVIRNFVPNQGDVKTIVGKAWEAYLIPGFETIIGYGVEAISPMPEQASVSVEP